MARPSASVRRSVAAPNADNVRDTSRTHAQWFGTVDRLLIACFVVLLLTMFDSYFEPENDFEFSFV